MAAPRLVEVTFPSRPRAAVLVLHGGGSRRGRMRVSPAQLSVLRMIPIAKRIADAGDGRLAVLRLLNSQRGWDTEHTPLADVAWALEQLAERLPGPLPVGLVGHSLGGRAALLSAGRSEVASVTALAPWVLPSDRPAGDIAGTRILIVHGDRDRVADPDRAEALAQVLARRTTVSVVTVAGGTHAMLSRRDAFDGLAARFTAATLLGENAATPELVGGDPLGRALAGERAIEV